MLIVDYTKQLGYIETKSGERYPFYSCNGLMAVCPICTRDDGTTYRYLHSFYDDINHMKRMLGLMPCRSGEKNDLFKTMFDEGIGKVVISSKWRSRATVANAFLNAGYCVQFE